MSKVKIFSIIAILLIVIGLFGSVVTFNKPYNRTNWSSVNEEFPVEELENIIITADNANVEILVHDDPMVRIKATGNNPEENVHMEAEGDRLFINLKHNRNKLFQFNIFSSMSSLKVYLPDKMFATIQAESDNGRIKGKGFNAKRITINTDNGLIELQDLDSEYVSVEADNGKITLDHVAGEIQAETDNGAISLITDTLDRNITLTTDVGMIDIKTNSEPTNAEITAHVDLGSINIYGHSNGLTRFGEGEHKVKLTTDIGKIKVK